MVLLSVTGLMTVCMHDSSRKGKERVVHLSLLTWDTAVQVRPRLEEQRVCRLTPAIAQALETCMPVSKLICIDGEARYSQRAQEGDDNTCHTHDCKRLEDRSPAA